MAVNVRDWPQHITCCDQCEDQEFCNAINPRAALERSALVHIRRWRGNHAMQTETIHMYLPDEAVDVWRPVQAEKLGADLYRILGPVPEEEVWQFPPGTIVRVQMKRLEGGDFPVAAYNAAH